jgi:YVTN family beta-propeller protein
MHRIGFVSLGFHGIPRKTTARGAGYFLAAFLGMLLLAGPAAAQSCAPNTANYPCAYVANNSDDTVSVINNNGTVIGTIGVGEGSGPQGVAITPDNSTVYVANSAGETISVINTATGAVIATITASGHPAAIAITPNGSFAYVAEPGSGFEPATSFIDVIDTSTNTVTTTISGTTNPTAIAITPNGAFAYAADECDTPGVACVDVINLSTNVVTTVIQLTGTFISSPNSIAITPDGAFVYVSARVTPAPFDTVIYVIATSNNTVVVSGDTLDPDSSPFLSSNFGFAIAPNNTLYIGIPQGTDSQRQDTVYTLATATNTFLPQITVGQNPTGLAVGRSGGIVYVTNNFDGTVSIIATGNNSVSGPITVGASPDGVGAMRVSALPLINQPLRPSATPAGGAGFTLTVNGTGFASNAAVKWNGTALTTTFVNQGQLTATVPAGDIASLATASITVTNPGPGGGTSNSLPFTVTSPTAALTFASASTDTVGTAPTYVLTADFNGDGKADLAVVNSNSGTVSILLGNGDGTFSSGTPLTTGTNPVSAAAGDFNADGKLDLAVVSNGTIGCDDGGTCIQIFIFLGNGDGSFATGTAIAVLNDGASAAQLIAGDFNGDGKIDLALATSINSVPSVFVYTGNGDGTFTFNTSVTVTALPSALATGDFNGDGILDLAVAESASPQVDILLGNGDGTFTPASSQPVTTLVTPVSVTTGDFNGDGKLDLAFADSSNGILTVLLGNGDGTFTLKNGQPVASQDLMFATTADFNGDGKLDLALVGSGTGGLVFVDLGNGDGTFQASSGFPVGNGPVASAFADFNGDGRLDLAVTNSTDGTVSILDQSPVVTPNPTSLPFGNQIIDTTSTSQSVAFTNSGSAPLSFGPVAITAGFAQINDCPTSGPGLLLLPGTFCTFIVTFTPTSVAPFEGTLSLGVSLPAPSVTSVLLTGTGTPLPVQITVQPASQSIVTGTTATLTVSATGTAPLTYQWFLGSSGDTTNPIASATSPSFTTPKLTATTSYWVQVTNGAGSKDSSTATITVTAVAVTPQITTQPASQTISPKQTATLTVVATGTTPLTYQWFQGLSGDTTNPIASATNPSFTTPTLAATTSYWVQVSNTAGSTNSSTATITVSSAGPTCTNLAFGPGSSLLQVTFVATCSATTVGTSINWGDGSPVSSGSSAAVSAPHTFAGIGTYSLTLTATDSLGRTGAPAFAQVTLVAASAPPPVFAGQSSDTPLMLAAPPNSTNNPVVKFECTTVTASDGTTQLASNLGLLCTSEPSTMTLTDTPQAVTISIQTSGTAADLRAPALRHLRAFYASWLALPGIIFMGLGMGVGSKTRKKFGSRLAIGLMICLLVFVVSCGGGFNQTSASGGGSGSGKKATPAGQYFVTAVDVPAQGTAPTGFVQTSLIVPLNVTGQ